MYFQDEEKVPYTGYGVVHKVYFLQRGLRVEVDINIKSPKDFDEKQLLPESDKALYKHLLEFAIIDSSLNMEKVRQALDNFEENFDPSSEHIKEAIITGKASKSLKVTLPNEIHVNGLPKNFSETQRKAVIAALS